MGQACVVGLGLIGGSISLALKKIGYNVVGVETDPAVSSYALDRSIVDSIGWENLDHPEVVFVCVPVSATRQMVEKAAVITHGEAVITDVASVKGILDGVKGRVVGGHPMAGVEKSGIEAARSHLFENAFYALVRYADTTDTDLHFIKSIVERFGAKPVILSSEAHDRRASKVSHLPHALAYALAGYALEEDGFFGSGFFDMTRIAASDPAFWTQISLLNRENLLADLDGFSARLDEIRAAIESEDREALEKIYAAAQSKREELDDLRVYKSEYFLDIDVVDKVGAIAEISGTLAKSGINISGIRILSSREGVGGALRVVVRSQSDYNRAKELLKTTEEKQ